MISHFRVHLQTLVLLTFVVSPSRPVCVDVLSANTAILKQNMKLTCISCMKREEVSRKTHVNWYFRPRTDENSTQERQQIYYRFDNLNETVMAGQFTGRLFWNGSQDFQDVSILITDITYNDSGIYECHICRQFKFGEYEPSWSIVKNISLTVKEEATRDKTAIYSEIMMYVLLVFLTSWLLVEMVYCYRKISKSDEQAQDTATNYLAIPSEQRDNPAAPVTE